MRRGFAAEKSGSSRIKSINLIAAPECPARFEKNHPDVPAFAAAKDVRINDRFYAVPGPGEAGDRIFGTL
ncbi:MAG: hypothetical protein J6T01_03285 [Kiritimatiellae bacterium]|nr:hypothetical protein [Kiritimatiellia bacterium]